MATATVKKKCISQIHEKDYNFNINTLIGQYGNDTENAKN